MKVLATSLLFPPGLGILICLIAFHFLKKKTLAFGRFLLFIGLVVSWGLSTEAMGRFLSVMLISEVEQPTNINIEEVDAIVVLTGGMNYAGEVGWLPRKESYRRGAVAFELQNRIGSRVPIIISGGKTAGLKHPSEAQVVQRQFDRHQAQITPVWLEESSSSTYENALHSVAMLKNKEMDTVFLVTSEIHMPRALAAFRGRGIDPIPFPVFALERRELYWGDYLPSWYGAETTAKALYEILGIVQYAAAGYIRLEDI